jgi:hypothetical protein
LRRGKARLRLGADRHLGDDGAPLGNERHEIAVLLGIDDVDAAGDDRDGASGERSLVRRRVDAAGESRDDDEAASAQLQRQVAGETPAIGRGVPRADHRDRRLRQERRVAAERQQRRRVVGGGERRGIIGLAPGDEARAHALHRRHLPLRRAAAADQKRPAPPGALGQLRQRVECGRGRAEALQQLIKGDRPDILAADEAQPVELFGGIEPARGHCPTTMRCLPHERQS